MSDIDPDALRHQIAEEIRRQQRDIESDMSEFQQRLDARDRNNRPPPKEPPVIVAETVIVEAKPIVTQTVTPTQPPIFPDSGSPIDTAPAKLTEWTFHEGTVIQRTYWIDTP